MPCLSVGYSALCNSYTLEMGKMSRNHFEASELIPMHRPKLNLEQKLNWMAPYGLKTALQVTRLSLENGSVKHFYGECIK